jgi:hypothetical protein
MSARRPIQKGSVVKLSAVFLRSTGFTNRRAEMKGEVMEISPCGYLAKVAWEDFDPSHVNVGNLVDIGDIAAEAREAENRLHGLHIGFMRR